MAELYVKPGNTQRGWNDPPQFSYGLQARGAGPRRTPLSRRAPSAPQGPPAGAPPDRPPAALGAPPLGPPGPALSARGTPSPVPGEEGGAAGGEVPVEAVLAPLREALSACRLAVQKQVCDDIGRRLTALGDAWARGKLSAPVRRRMVLLVRGEGGGGATGPESCGAAAGRRRVPLRGRAGAAPLGRGRRDPSLADGGPRERGEPVAGGCQAADRRVQEPVHGRSGRGRQRSRARPGGACTTRGCGLSRAAGGTLRIRASLLPLTSLPEKENFNHCDISVVIHYMMLNKQH
uniref:Steroid receptor RNA activator 1 n=1 Tax=Pavo cristatus TaxID=9049 RepID=A0A8C9ETU0_PAVCR